LWIGPESAGSSVPFKRLSYAAKEGDPIVQPIFECHLRVDACDIDSTGKLKVSSVFNHIQNLAAVHAQGLGAGIGEMLTLGMFWVLSWVKLEFAFFPMFGEEFSAKTWPKCRHRLFSIRDFLFCGKNGDVFCRGTTAWLMVDLKTKKAKNPMSLQLNIPYQENESALCCYPERFPPEHAGTTVYTRKIRYSDLDLNRHVNNARYIELLMDCFDVEHHQKHQIRSFTVSFVSEAKYGDEIDLLLADDSDNGSSHFIEALNVKSGKPVVQAVIEWMPSEQGGVPSCSAG
jgi:medium-chain acyl-[acyl-carrier-protein] hydrolase